MELKVFKTSLEEIELYFEGFCTACSLMIASHGYYLKIVARTKGALESLVDEFSNFLWTLLM